MSLACIDEFKMSLMSMMLWLDADHYTDPASTTLSRMLRRLHDHMERPLRIIVLGEANSGKSSLVNLIVGNNMAPTSVVANTLWPVMFKYSQRACVRAVMADGSRRELDPKARDPLGNIPLQMVEVGLPLERLRLVEVIDTPGAESAQDEDESWQVRYRAGDLLIWCTVATQAWKETERRAWSEIPARVRTNSVLAVTRVDQLIDQAAVTAVRQRLAQQVAAEFGAVIPLSLSQALSVNDAVRTAEGSELWRSSGAEDLENAIAFCVLDSARGRIAKAKLALSRMVRRWAAINAFDDSQTGIVPSDRLRTFRTAADNSRIAPPLFIDLIARASA
jgi:GTPase SAR1 family protein